MRFYNREVEISGLLETASRAEQQAQMTFVVGRRRIGKTALILQTFRKQKFVYLFGDINTSATVLPFDSNKGVKDYLEDAGGIRDTAYSEIFIIDPDGKQTSLSTKFPFKYIENRSANIFPGTVIYVPKDIGKQDGLTYASTVAPVLSSLALTLASLNSIN